VTYHIASDWALRGALQRSLRDVIADQAALGPWHQPTVQSARRALYRRQAAGLLLALAAWP
jgi:hypothetical protein